VLSFNPANLTATVGQTFSVDVVVSGAQDLFTVPVQIQYDPTKLQLANVSSGDFLEQGEQAVALAQRDDAANGMMQVTANRPPNSGGVSGQGSVFTLTFLAKDSGQATVAVTRAGLRDVNNQPIAAAGTQAAVSIKERPQAAEKTDKSTKTN
jgi:general secretion pathway protein D